MASLVFASNHANPHALLVMQGALLLLLFQISHFLEEKFTARASGSLSRLFAAVPSKATLVQMNEADASPQMATAQPVRASTVAIGQYVLVKPGEQVRCFVSAISGCVSVAALLHKKHDLQSSSAKLQPS